MMALLQDYHMLLQVINSSLLTRNTTQETAGTRFAKKPQFHPVFIWRFQFNLSSSCSDKAD